MEAVLAVAVFLGIGALGTGAYLWLRSDDTPRQAEDSVVAPPSAQDTAEIEPAPSRDAPPVEAPSLNQVAWTLDAPMSLRAAARAWSVPKDTLQALNPGRGLDESLPAGTSVVVHDGSQGGSISIGPPNDGRLVRGMPLPEGDGWRLPDDRGRAFGTHATVASVVAALHAYQQRFPDAVPIQMGDLSARKGGRIYGHQSHQTGLDVDIRLVRDASGEGFDAARTWFLVKALVDGSGGDPVRAIFLNRTEQVWLRAAAEADVGAAEAARYFSLIRHEPGHTIHMHVRFKCASEHKRCVGYSLPDTDEQDTKPSRKLPSASAKRRRGRDKRPRLAPKKRN